MSRAFWLVMLLLFASSEAQAAKVKVCGQEVQQTVTTTTSTSEEFRKFLGIYVGMIAGECRAYMLDHIVPARTGYVMVKYRKIGRNTPWEDPERLTAYFTLAPEKLTFINKAIREQCDVFQLEFKGTDGNLSCQAEGRGSVNTVLQKIAAAES